MPTGRVVGIDDYGQVVAVRKLLFKLPMTHFIAIVSTQDQSIYPAADDILKHMSILSICRVEKKHFRSAGKPVAKGKKD